MYASSDQNLCQNTAALSQLTGLVYDAAIDRSLWTRFLERLCDVLDFRAANFLISTQAPDGQISALPASVGFDESSLRDYENHFAFIDPHHAPALEMTSGSVALSNQLVPAEEFVRSEYFNDFYSKKGMRLSLSTMIHNDGNIMTLLGGHRGHDQPTPSADEIRFMHLLTPHLQRARVLSERLGTLGAEGHVLANVLDRLPTGIVFVDESGSFLRANAAGDAILNQQDGLRLQHGRLVTDDLRSTRSFEAIVATACAGGEVLAGPTSLRIPRPSGRHHLTVMAFPIDADSSVWSDGLAAAFLLVCDGEVELRGAALRMRELYGLSEIEANLAVGLARGATVKECAEERGVSVETVRWQLKQVFSKTGTSRQPELIRIVLTGPAFMR